MKKNRILIFLSVAASIVLIGIAFIFYLGRNYKSNQSNQVSDDSSSFQEYGVDLGSAPVLGNLDAPVTLIEFADFQCPACNIFFQKIEPLLRENYVKTGKVKVVFKTLTFIDNFDGNRAPEESFLAGAAGECAKEQGKFWMMHDAIFNEEKREMDSGKNSENSGNLNMSFFMKVAADLNLDTQIFEACLKDEIRHRKQFERNMREAEKLMAGRVSTPTVFINGKMIKGVERFFVYQDAIEKAILNLKE